MPEPVDWGADGTPRSPRFDDIYRPAAGGLAQARHVFLGGCGLPGAWAGRRQWRILETGFGLGLNFLAAWQAWRDDPQRPGLLHFVSVEAFPVAAHDLLRSTQAHPELLPLAQQLAAQWDGLLPGFHRLAFEGGRVLLTLCVGDVGAMLREQAFLADSMFLDGFDPRTNPAMWDLQVFKAVARLAHRGTGLATWSAAGEVRRGLAQCGFRIEKADGLPPKLHCVRGVFDPAWEPKGLAARTDVPPGRCAVVGGGLAGAAAAASLARRGWQVQVLDAAERPAAGASGLPAGLLAPHQSPDDNLLSRLSRAGVRATLQQADTLLAAGPDWSPTGVLERRIDDDRPPPHESVWTRAAAGGDWWHEQAAWVRPGALVEAWLRQGGIVWRGGCAVSALERNGAHWSVRGAGAAVLAEVDLVVVAAAHASARLLGDRVTLHPVRGQVSWSTARALPAGTPSHPVNGNGHFVPHVPMPAGDAWLCGSTYGRGETTLEARAEDHLANLDRLRVLLPHVAAALAPVFMRGEVRAWTGVRCASQDRRPLAGPVENGLWVVTALGSRGLTFSVLCAELVAARLHGEPWPVERTLGTAVDVARAVR